MVNILIDLDWLQVDPVLQKWTRSCFRLRLAHCIVVFPREAKVSYE